ncbi:MAG: hypothetical protein ABIK92_08825 [Pseudomonadota bacterium]
MNRNPEVYRTKEKHWAFHPLTGYPEQMQWWHTNAIFDNGYNLSCTWFVTDYSATVGFQICDPQGNMTIESYVPFEREDVSASTETLDIKMGDNYYRGKFPKYEYRFFTGDMGVELVFESLTQPLLGEPPDGAYIGRVCAPTTPIFFTYFIRPRSRVTGKLILAGKEIPVSGEGYADHQWTNMKIGDIFDYWYWGSPYLPNHTLVYWEVQMTDPLGCQKAKWLWALKGDKLFDYSRNGEYYIEASELELDAKSGIMCPHKVVLTFDHPGIKGTITHKLKHIISRQPVPITPNLSSSRQYQYFRYLSDVDAKLEIDGEKVQSNKLAIHEVAL